jgi:hypothetical protein
MVLEFMALCRKNAEGCIQSGESASPRKNAEQAENRQNGDFFPQCVLFGKLLNEYFVAFPVWQSLLETGT